MKYDARACHFNMDTGCVELLLRDGRMISINCTGVEDALDVTMAQRFELDYLIYNDPLAYAELLCDILGAGVGCDVIAQLFVGFHATFEVFHHRQRVVILGFQFGDALVQGVLVG